MRLVEIDTNSTEDNKILRTFGRYFYTSNGATKLIQNTGMSVVGDVRLVIDINKFPVKFSEVAGNFYCDNSNLETLEGSPKNIGGDFHCDHNELISLEGGPDLVDGNYYCYNNPLQSLKGLPKYIGSELRLSYHEDLPLLAILFVKQLKAIEFIEIHPTTKHIIRKILHKYLGQGKKGALQCAVELTKAGFKGNAKL